MLQQYLPFTVLKPIYRQCSTTNEKSLQQYLPFTVLKLVAVSTRKFSFRQLQQYLPFTVLKPSSRRCASNTLS